MQWWQIGHCVVQGMKACMFAFSGTCTPMHMPNEENLQLLYQSSCVDGEQIDDFCHYSNLGSMTHGNGEIEKLKLRAEDAWIAVRASTMLLEGKSTYVQTARKLNMIYSPNIQQQKSNTSIKSVAQLSILRSVIGKKIVIKIIVDCLCYDNRQTTVTTKDEKRDTRLKWFCKGSFR